jgi:translation initiation factor IF-2
MTRKEAFEKIQKLLFGEQKMAEAKLADGTIIQWEGDLVEGAAINVIAEDGNTTPAPDATHELEDGTKITTVGGLVTSIEKPEMETEVEVEDKKEKMASEFETAFANHVEAFAGIVSRVEALENAVKSYEEKFSAINTEVEGKDKSINEKFAAITEIVKEIAETPAEPSEKNKPNGAVKFLSEKKEKALTADDKINAFLQWKAARK